MKFFSKAHDGGPDSGVTGFYFVEIKSLFSIVLLRFSKGTRDAYHNHAFNAITIWLWGSVKEHLLEGETLGWKAGRVKYTPRGNFHQVEALTTSWALSFRGPWVDRWNEYRNSRYLTLTHGRKVI